MSARIRLTAKTAVNATAITATRIVMGRRRAARISHIGQRAPADGFTSDDERRERALRHGLRQQRAPHVDPRELVLHFGLREQALRVRHFDDAREARLIAGARLRFALLRRRELHRRVGGDGPGGLHHRRGCLLLARDRQQRLVVQRRLGARRRRRRGLAGAEAGEVEDVGKDDLDAGRPVRAIETEARDAAVELRHSAFAPLPRANTLDWKYTRGRSVRDRTSSCARATSMAA